MEDFDRAIVLDPSYAAAYANRGVGHIYFGNYDRACKDFQKACGILIALVCVAWGLDNNHTASIHDLDPVRCTFLKGITFGNRTIISLTKKR